MFLGRFTNITSIRVFMIRSFAVFNSGRKILEATALAMLRCGRSFAEAAESTHLPVKDIIALWQQK